KLNPVGSPAKTRLGRPKLSQLKQATGVIALKASGQSHPGVTDGIEQDIETEDEPGGSEGSCQGNRNQGKYAEATGKGSQAKGHDLGMEAGLAMKSGNADGVKASTDIEPRNKKHSPYTTMENEW